MYRRMEARPRVGEGGTMEMPWHYWILVVAVVLLLVLDAVDRVVR